MTSIRRAGPVHGRRSLVESLEGLTEAGWGLAEVYSKRSRVRRFGIERTDESTVLSEEMGWAARAGSSERSLFLASSGPPRRLSSLPAAGSGGLRLPPSRGFQHWRPPADLETPLLGEGEGHRLLRSISKALADDHPEGRLVRALLEDGAGEVAIRSSLGVAASYRSRLSTLRLEVELPGRPSSRCGLSTVARCASDFRAAALGRRLADVLHVRSEGVAPEGGAQCLLSPEVGSRLLGFLASTFVGDGNGFLAVRGGKVGADDVVLIEDGSHRAGPIAAPVDGEGLPYSRRVLVDHGSVGERILPWWSEGRHRGGSSRPGWRDRPRLDASQVFLEVSEPVSVAALLSEVRQGYYLIESPRAGSFDRSSGLFSLPVCGFNVSAGRPVSPLADARLQGDLREFLHCVRGSARDLGFHPRGALVGVPSLLVEGLEVV